jgi:hypothetical protein
MTSPQPPTTPAGRYGDATPTGRRPLGRGAKVAIGAALAAAVAMTAWFAFSQQQAHPVDYDEVGFHVNDAESVDVTFQVHMPAGTTAVCTIEALSPSFAQVGTLDVEVGPSQDLTSVYEVTVGTSQEATSGVVAGCEPTS